MTCYQLAYLILLLEYIKAGDRAVDVSQPTNILDANVCLSDLDELPAELQEMSISKLGKSPNVIVYDPKSPQEDMDYYEKKLGFTFSKPDDLKARQKTLFYMLHCPHDLYEDLFRANDDAESLGNVLVLGNDLGDYRERTGFKEVEKAISNSNLIEIGFPLAEFHSNVFAGTKWAVFDI